MTQEHEHEQLHKKRNKWMLPLAFILPFLFFIPLTALVGLILAGISFKNSHKKLWPIVAIILNLVLGFFNLLFTLSFIEVFFLGK